MKIENDQDYNFALKRLQEIFDAPVGTPESDEADELVKRIDEYEQTHYPIDRKD